MIKNLTGGAIINYGPDFPADAAAFDGALYFKSTGTDQGLYIFGFTQDANLSQLGEQVVQGWNPIVTAANFTSFVNRTGDTMTGALGITGSGSTNDPYGRVSVTLPSDSNSYGYYGLTRQGAVGWSIGIDTSNRLFFGTGSSGTLNNVASRPLTISTDGGMLIAGNTVWHAGNDGPGSGMNADLLDNFDSSDFRNAGNLNAGTLDINRLPFAPVQQGGGGSQGANKIYIGWISGASAFGIQVDSTNFGSTWPISVTGNASTANFASSATNATSASYLAPFIGAGAGGVTTGRNVWAPGAYTYNSHSDPNAPTTYMSTIGFGNATNGAGEIAVNWIGNGAGMWYRGLRDTTDPWWAWTRVLDTANYNAYSPTLTGGGASGTWGINISGSAAHATTADSLTNAPGAITPESIGAIRVDLTNAPAPILNSNVTAVGIGAVRTDGSNAPSNILNTSVQLSNSGGTITLSNAGSGSFVALTTANPVDATNIAAWFATGAITGPYIADATIGTAKIQLLAVTTALIADAAIASAKIGDLQVGTIKIASGAITTAYSSSSAGLSTSVVVTIPGGSRSLTVMAFLGGYNHYVGQQEKGGGPIWIVLPFEGSVSASSVFGSNTSIGTAALSAIDPAAGTYTFTATRTRSEYEFGSIVGNMVLVVLVTQR